MVLPASTEFCENQFE